MDEKNNNNTPDEPKKGLDIQALIREKKGILLGILVVVVILGGASTTDVVPPGLPACAPSPAKSDGV